MSSIVNEPSGKRPALKIFDPTNIVIYFTLFSPIVLMICVVASSFVSRNFKGFAYLLFLTIFSVFRNIIYGYAGGDSSSEPASVKSEICDLVQYSSKGNDGFSVFVFAFSIFYICLPMFVNKNVSYNIIIGLMLYFVLDVSVKKMYICISSINILINTLAGIFCALLALSLLYSVGQLKHLLFFNESPSNNEVCSMSEKQTFKCSVFKNGELIGSSTS
jgi:hypothetical protein